VADAPEPSPAGFEVVVQDILDLFTEIQIGITDDRRYLDAVRARARLSEFCREIRLTDTSVALGSAASVGGRTFDVHRIDDIVAPTGVNSELVKQVPAFRRQRPEVMVRVTDRQIRLKRFFSHQPQPSPPIEPHLTPASVCNIELRLLIDPGA
jgi:hypothetical protein